MVQYICVCSVGVGGCDVCERVMYVNKYCECLCVLLCIVVVVGVHVLL